MQTDIASYYFDFEILNGVQADEFIFFSIQFQVPFKKLLSCSKKLIAKVM
jgi:hypothetical protein